jgi:hypothetical protein
MVSDTLFLDVTAAHYQGDSLLEKGVMAELDGKPNPQFFAQALNQFEKSLAAMNALDQRLDALIAIYKRSPENPKFKDALNKMLKEAKPCERVSLKGERYSNVATEQPKDAPSQPTSLLEIMEAQKADLKILRGQMKETIEAFRGVIPLAEKHQFAAMMLSGREGFADKIQQSVDLVGRYGRFYTTECMATIAATMQPYPSGLEWIKDTLPKGTQ